MRSNEIEAYKKKLKLTKRQREIIVGLLLGDGHLETQNGLTYRLKVEHSFKQNDYVDWLYDNFREWVNQHPRQRIKDSFGKEFTSYGFTTYSSGSLRFYGQQFYSGKRKVIPKLIKKLLTPLSLAIWFMDDGSWKSNKHRTYIIHTLGYDRQELNLMKRILEEKFGITTGIHRQYNGLRLYIMSSSASQFRNIIEPYVIPSMRYKLG